MNIFFQQVINGSVLGVDYALFALGLTLIWGALRILNMAHGAIFMWGAMFAVLIGTAYHPPLLIMLPLSMIGAGLIAVAIDVIAFRPLRSRNMRIEDLELGSLIASIGFSIILISIANRITVGQVVHIPRDILPITAVHLGNFIITNISILILVLGVLLTGLVALAVQSTKVGKALRAIAFDPGVTAMLGVNVNRVTMISMFAAGALAGAAGVLLSLQLGAADYQMGEPLLLDAFAIIIVGGVGSIPGALVGGLVIGLVQVLALTYLTSQAADILTFLVLVLVLLIRPQGLFGATRARTV